MVPSGLAGLIAFVAFVAPGALFDLLVGRARPRPDETTFEEANRIVLVSVVSVAGALSVLLLPRFWFPQWLGPLVGAVRTGGDAWRHQLLGVGLGLLALLSFAMLLAAVGAGLWIRTTPGGNIRRESQWYLAFRRGRPSGTDEVYVITEGEDGVRHFGRLEAYSEDIGAAEAQVTLKAPIYRGTKGGGRKTELVNVHRVVLGSSDLRRVYVTYEAPRAT